MSDSHSALMARDYRFFEAARKAALESDFPTRVGAIAVYGGRVIASAFSSQKTNPLQSKYNIYRKFQTDCADCLPKVHAEMGVLAKLKKMDVPMGEVKIYVYRVCKSREHGYARPCSACYHALLAAGLKVCYYTTDIGFCCEWLEDYKEA